MHVPRLHARLQQVGSQAGDELKSGRSSWAAEQRMQPPVHGATVDRPRCGRGSRLARWARYEPTNHKPAVLTAYTAAAISRSPLEPSSRMMATLTLPAAQGAANQQGAVCESKGNHVHGRQKNCNPDLACGARVNQQG